MKTFLFTFLRFLVYAIVMLGCSMLIELDFKNGSANENDVIEIAQHIVLLVIIIIGFLSVLTNKSHQVFMAILSLFITAHLIREHDAWFDFHFPSIGWFPFVVILIIISVAILIKKFKLFIEQTNALRNTLGFGILLIALVNLHVFTRFYGKPSIWKSIMGDNYLYQVERISEEAVELVAYTMMFIAMVELFFQVKKGINKSV